MVLLVFQVDKCFGFDTAVEEAQRALLAAKVEASSGYRGLGIVKLMGRSSGFIAMQASMASGACCCGGGGLDIMQSRVGATSGSRYLCTSACRLL